MSLVPHLSLLSLFSDCSCLAPSLSFAPSLFVSYTASSLSVHTGANIVHRGGLGKWADYFPSVKDLLDGLRPPNREFHRPLRLVIDRTYNVKGVGTVFVGTILQGIVREGKKPIPLSFALSLSLRFLSFCISLSLPFSVPASVPASVVSLIFIFISFLALSSIFCPLFSLLSPLSSLSLSDLSLISHPLLSPIGQHVLVGPYDDELHPVRSLHIALSHTPTKIGVAGRRGSERRARKIESEKSGKGREK